MENRIALINSIEINRNVKLLDVARTMIIYVTEEEKFPDYFAENLKICRNEHELLSFIKNEIDDKIEYKV